MAILTIPINLDQLFELVRQLAPEERRALLDRLMAERFDAAISEGDQQRTNGSGELTDEQVQAEVDAVRRQRRQERLRATGG